MSAALPAAPPTDVAAKTIEALAAEHRQAGLVWSTATLIAAMYAAAYFQSYTPPVMFVISVLGMYVSAPPRYLFSPRNFLTGYHMVFYGLAVMLAERYQQFDFTDRPVVISYLMVITSFVVCYLTLFHTETWLGARGWVQKMTPPPATSRRGSLLTSLFMLVAGVACAAGMVQASGGVQHWMHDPARAFLGREGGGAYYLGFIMCVGIGCAAAGVFAAQSRNWFVVLCCLVLIAALAPLLGGKQRTFTMIAYTALPWTFAASVMSRSTLFMMTGLVGSFTALTYLRNKSWITASDFLGYTLNYFSTFDNLVLSVRDFEPSWFQTIFLPFNKLLTPFGLGNSSVFYDMNNWLTSIYLPHIWALRCTEQWPVETDLYLSTYYVFGIPLLMLSMVMYGLLFNLAIRTRSVGLIYVSAYATFYMVSHLRGSLLLWTDFYTFPYWIMSYWVLKKLSMPDVALRLSTQPMPLVHPPRRTVPRASAARSAPRLARSSSSSY
jgi:hypothetical protein